VTTLTRRPDKDTHREGWNVYFGDVRVGHIGIQAGVPNDCPQWGWSCGFSPGCDPGQHYNGTADTFEEARAEFEEAWARLRPTRNEVHFEIWRRNRDWTAGNTACSTQSCRCRRRPRTIGRGVSAGRRLQTGHLTHTSTNLTAASETDSQSRPGPHILVLGMWELRMSSPSIIPNDRLDRDIYLVLEDFRAGAAWRETDEDGTDASTVVEDLLTGQYEQPLRVVAFNPAEGWSRDATEEIAEELERRIAAGREVSETLQDFIESNIGRKIGVQLALPLHI
jgi:hypothetical protein